MNELSKERMMTIKELEAVLNVGNSTVNQAVKELFPNLLQNGIKTYLNEMQSSEVAKYVKTNHPNNLLKNQKVSTTYLEDQRILEAMTILIDRDKKQKQLLLEQKEVIINKTGQVNRLIHSNKTYTVSEIAGELNIRSAVELNKILQDMEIQYKVNGTWKLYAKYSNCGYIKTKQQELDSGVIVYYTHWTGLGRDFILDLLNKEGE